MSYANAKTLEDTLSLDEFSNLVIQSTQFLDSINETQDLIPFVSLSCNSFVNSDRITSAERDLVQLYFSQALSCASLDDIITLTNVYIKEINADVSLSEAEKQRQLSYLAVASHSFSYWASESGAVSASGRKWWSYLIIGGADALGALISSPILAAAVGGVASTVASDLTE